MRRDSIERTGRLGDFQWRFLNGSLFSKMGWTRGNKPDGSVYSTIERRLVNEQTKGIGGCLSHLPVTLLEPACGDVSIFLVLYLGRGRGEENKYFKMAFRSGKSKGRIPQTMKHETKSSIATIAGGSWRVPDAVVWLFSARRLSRYAQATLWQFHT